RARHHENDRCLRRAGGIAQARAMEFATLDWHPRFRRKQVMQLVFEISRYYRCHVVHRPRSARLNLQFCGMLEVRGSDARSDRRALERQCIGGERAIPFARNDEDSECGTFGLETLTVDFGFERSAELLSITEARREQELRGREV